MALTGIEHEWLTPRYPLSAIISGQLVQIGGSGLDRDMVTTRDLTLGVDSAWSGVIIDGRTTWAEQLDVATSGSKLFYIASERGSRYLAEWDISTRLGRALWGSGALRGAIAAAGDWIVGANYRYQISTDTATSGGAVNVGAVGSRLFAPGQATQTLTEYDPATMSVIATWSWPIVTPITAQYGRPTVIGTKIYWPTNQTATPIVGLDTSTDTTIVATPTPPGWGDSTNPIYAGPDGYLYQLRRVGGSDTIYVTDPTTNRWASDTLPTARTERTGQLLFHNGKMLIPSGQPLTWPL